MSLNSEFRTSSIFLVVHQEHFQFLNIRDLELEEIDQKSPMTSPRKILIKITFKKPSGIKKRVFLLEP